MWDHLKLLATHPRNLVEIFGGNVAAQLFVALALGASLHAFGQHLGLATLLVVLTLGSMLGGISPVPGGMGVVEAGMIIGLTAAGIPETGRGGRRVRAAAVHRLPAAHLGLVRPGVDAEEGVPLIPATGAGRPPCQPGPGSARSSRPGERSQPTQPGRGAPR